MGGFAFGRRAPRRTGRAAWWHGAVLGALLALGTTHAADVVAYSFHSDLLARSGGTRADVAYRVVLPPGFAHDRGPYPVAYLLHGSGGASTDWTGPGHVLAAADRVAANGSLDDFLLVLPDDAPYRTLPPAVRADLFARSIATELVSDVDARLPTIAAPAGRAIAGVSFGGSWAVYLALTRPDVFGAGGGLGALFWPAAPGPTAARTNLLGHFFGTPERAARFSAHHAVPRARSDGVAIFLATGTADGFAGSCLELYEALAGAGADVRLVLVPGDHGWLVWADLIDPLLAHLRTSLRQRSLRRRAVSRRTRRADG